MQWIDRDVINIINLKMGSVPHSHSVTDLSLTPESSLFLHKVQHMKYHKSHANLILKTAQTQQEIQKALRSLKNNKYLYTEQEITQQTRSCPLQVPSKNSRASLGSELKLPRITVKVKAGIKSDLVLKRERRAGSEFVASGLAKAARSSKLRL